MPDEKNWCAEAEELRVARRTLVLGKGVVEVGFGEDRVRYGRADMAALDSLIREAETKCDLAQGVKRRRRYAMPARFNRPY